MFLLGGLFSCGINKEGDSRLVEEAIKREYCVIRKRSLDVVQFCTTRNRFLAGDDEFQTESDWGADFRKLSVGQSSCCFLHFRFMQFLSEYPEAKMTSEEQITSLGETFSDLVKRLDEALHNFVEGPPFTLQRLCEILLHAQGIYLNLSKLALALEKNLLVTSMLSISTDLYQRSTIQQLNEADRANEEPQLHSNSVQNGLESMVTDRDEEMTEVGEADINDDMTIDMEAFEDIVGSGSLESNTIPNNNS